MLFCQPFKNQQQTRKQETKKPKNKKKQETNKLKNQETKQRKNQKNKKTKQPKKQDCTPQGEGSSGRELGLVIFSNVFLWFLVFFWILVLFSHCTKNQQRTRKQETKKPKKQKKQETKKQKNKKKIGKKTRLHTPRGGVVAESWVLSFFQTFFCGFLFFFGSWFCLAIAQKINNEPENKKPRNQKNKKKQETKKQKKQKKSEKKTRLHTPRGGVVAESWVLSFFQTFFCGFLFFFDLGFV